jgi:hypothetical protein
MMGPAGISPVFETDPEDELWKRMKERKQARHWRDVANRVGDRNAADSYVREIKYLDESIRQLQAIIKRGRYEVL